MVEKDFNEYDMKLAEWRGHVLASIEAMNKENTQLREEVKLLGGKIDDLSLRLTAIQVKVAALGGTAGIITSIVLWIITKV